MALRNCGFVIRLSNLRPVEKGKVCAAWPGLKRQDTFLPLGSVVSRVAVPECRFVLGTFDENEIRDEDGYSIFEPELSVYIGELNVFGRIYGKPKLDNVVIMHAREEWLKSTISMIRDVDDELPRTEYDYDLLGSQYSIVALRRGGDLDLYTEKEFGALRTPKPVGRVTVREWVSAIASISRQLSDLFRRLQPGLFSDSLFQREELALQEIESWLIAGQA